MRARHNLNAARTGEHTSAPDAQVAFSVPVVPPGVNHYARHTRAGAHYQTGETRAFKEAVRLLAGGRCVRFDAYAVCMAVYLGHGQRLDCDGPLKVAIDSLQVAGVIDSDAKVTLVVALKRRRRDNPGTEFLVCAASYMTLVMRWMEQRQ